MLQQRYERSCLQGVINDQDLHTYLPPKLRFQDRSFRESGLVGCQDAPSLPCGNVETLDVNARCHIQVCLFPLFTVDKAKIGLSSKIETADTSPLLHEHVDLVISFFSSSEHTSLQDHPWLHLLERNVLQKQPCPHSLERALESAPGCRFGVQFDVPVAISVGLKMRAFSIAKYLLNISWLGEFPSNKSTKLRSLFPSKQQRSCCKAQHEVRPSRLAEL
jgi:hypothetical protein